MDNNQTMKIPEKSFLGRAWQRVSTSEYLYLLGAFFLPFAIMLGVYACLGMHPFGNNSVLTLDLQAQYVYYYEEVRNLLVHGGSWLYSWKRTLGGEFMGIVAYYMGSPFNLLLTLFPKERLADAIMFIQLCKIGTMSVTFAYYLHKTRRPGEMKTIALSMMYSLCAYSVVQTIDPMWIDALVFLPLLILGTERLIRHKRIVLYIISLSLIFISNYYMGYMCGIFTFIYFCYYYFTVRPELIARDGGQGGKIKKIFASYGFRTFLRFCFATATALAISAFMLYPAWYSLQFGKLGWTTNDFSLSLRFDFFDLFVKMLTGSYDSVNRQGLPMIYCGVLTLILLPLFYISKSVPKRQKIAASCVLLVLIASFCVNTFDLAWHGFSTPNWLNYRYSYVFSFFVLTLACDALKDIRKIKASYIIGSGVAVATLIIITQKLHIQFNQGDERLIDLDDAGCILLSFILVIVYTVIISGVKNKKTEDAVAFILAAIVCVEMFASSLLSINAVHEEVGLTRYDNYLDSYGNEIYYTYRGEYVRTGDTVNDILESDKSFYRMESKLYRCNVNGPMGFGYNGIAHSTSTFNGDIIRMMDKIGYASDSHWTKYIGGTPVSDALFGIKYVITENDLIDKNIYTVAAQEKEGYQLVPSDNIIYGMQNTKALSIAYGVSGNVIEDMKYSTYPPFISGIDFQNRLLESMLSETPTSGTVFKGIYVEPECRRCLKYTFNQDHTYTVDGETFTVTNSYYNFQKSTDGAEVIFNLTAPADGPIYFHFTSENYGKTCVVYVNGARKTDYFGIETSCIMTLGTFNAGDEVQVSLSLNDDNLYISKESDYFFYYIDYEELGEAFDRLSGAEMTVDDFGNDYLKGSIYLPEGQTTIFTSIPYDEGWNVYIDGERAETVKVMDSLLAIPSGAGYHEIYFRYMPSGYKLAFAISGAALVLFIAVFVLAILQRRGKVKLFKCDGGVLAAKCPDMLFPTEGNESEDEVGGDGEAENKVGDGGGNSEDGEDVESKTADDGGDEDNGGDGQSE